jgi:hypothetical protein
MWVLILFMHSASPGNLAAFEKVEGFSSQASCYNAGKHMTEFLPVTMRFGCIKKN